MQVLIVLWVKLLASLVPGTYHRVTRVPQTPLNMIWKIPKAKLRLAGNALSRGGAQFPALHPNGVPLATCSER